MSMAFEVRAWRRLAQLNWCHFRSQSRPSLLACETLARGKDDYCQSLPVLLPEYNLLSPIPRQLRGTGNSGNQNGFTRSLLRFLLNFCPFHELNYYLEYWDTNQSYRIPFLSFPDELIANGETGTFDLVYIDADKWNYAVYYDKCMELVRKGGLILLDDVRIALQFEKDGLVLYIIALNPSGKNRYNNLIIPPMVWWKIRNWNVCLGTGYLKTVCENVRHRKKCQNFTLGRLHTETTSPQWSEFFVPTTRQ